MRKELYIKMSGFASSQIIAILKQPEAGSRVPELCCEHGTSNVTIWE